MRGLRMFVSMLLIDGAVLFVLYGLIAVVGWRGSFTSFTRAPFAEPRSPVPDIGRYR